MAEVTGGIPLSEVKFHWQPDNDILKSWRIHDTNDSTIKCKYCDFTMVYDLSHLKYPLVNWPYYDVEDLVYPNPGLEYYKKRYALGLIQQKHWDTAHKIPSDWESDWDDSDGWIQCKKCGFSRPYEDMVEGLIKELVLEICKKFHRRVCYPGRFTYA